MGKYSEKREYNKLIRDGIPHKLDKKGVSYETHTASPDEFLVKLKEKLIEEASEVAQADTQEAIREELADVAEVIDALRDFYKIEADEVRSVQQQKKKKRGGFDRRTILDWS